MLVAKEARIIPIEAKNPPIIITGRQPNLFTNTLHRGPLKQTTMVYILNAIKISILTFSSFLWVTCAIEHGKQNWWDPGSVTVSNTKLPNQFLKENTDCLGESIGEPRDDEAANQHGPAPPSIRCLHSRRSIVNHGSSHGAFCLWCWYNQNKSFIITNSIGQKSFVYYIFILFIVLYCEWDTYWADFLSNTQLTQQRDYSICG